MGNSASSNVVYVQLDQEAHESGSCVSGNVYVNVDESSADITALYIKVEGVETTRFRVTSTQGAEVNEPGIHARGRTQFFSVTVPLQLPPQLNWKHPPTQASQLQVPFSFHLPVGIRPSFSFETRRTKANITYTVTAVLKVDRTGSNRSGQIEGSTPMTVYSRVPPAMSLLGTQVESSGEGDIADCCAGCMRCPAVCVPCRGCACVRGHTWCLLGINTGHVANGGTLQPQAMVQNHSSIPIQCTLRLVRCVRVFGSGAGAYRTTGTTSEEEAWRHVECPIPPDCVRTHRATARIPFPMNGAASFPPSVLGELIQCTYRVEAVVQPVAGCCVSKIRTSIPVVVHTVDELQQAPAAPAAPPQWNPLIMQQQDVALPKQGLAAPQMPIGIHSDDLEPLLPPPTQQFAAMSATTSRSPVV